MIEPRVEEVGEGLYAFVQPDGSWMINNAGFIAGRSAVVSIDTCSTEQRTRAYQAAIASVTDTAVRTVVNTHSHPDHTAGNCIFRPATVVAHELCRAELEAAARRGPPPMTMFDHFERGDLELELPLVTLTDRLDLSVDGLRVELHAVGEPAHTTNDVVAWVPERSVLYTGDLVFNGGTPFLMGGSVEGWRRALHWLRGFGAQTLVPGHGEVCDDEVLSEIDGYLIWLQAVARAGHDEGIPPLDLAYRTDLGEYASWSDPERIVANLHRAYSELDGNPPGAPLDVSKVFSEMVELNGGPLHCEA